MYKWRIAAGVTALMCLQGMSASAFASGSSDVSETVREAVQRTVSDTVSDVISDAIQDSFDPGVAMAPGTEANSGLNSGSEAGLKPHAFWIRPSKSVHNIDGTGFNSDAHTNQALAGFILGFGKWYASATVGLADTEVNDATTGDFDSETRVASLGATYIFKSSAKFTTWGTVLANYSDNSTDGADDVETYGLDVAPTVMYKMDKDTVLLGTIGLTVSDSDVEGSDESWATYIGGTVKHKSGNLRPQMNIKLNRSLEEDDSLHLSVSPELRWILANDASLGLGYAYSKLLEDDYDTVEFDGHQAYLNFRMQF